MPFWRSACPSLRTGDILLTAESQLHLNDLKRKVCSRMRQQRLEEVIEKNIRPLLREHGGDIRVASFDDTSGILRVELSGSCLNCPAANYETRDFLRSCLCTEIPEIRDVEIVQYVDREMLNLVRRILNYQTTDRSCAVKYCGGCNPHYDREQAVREIEARIGKKLVRACVGETYDVLYVVCGCPSRCADISGLCADRIVMIDTADVSNQISNSIGSKNYDF